MNYDDMVTVYTLNDPYEAEVVRTAIREQGISCELDGGRQAGLSEILEIGVLVRVKDEDRARTIIRSAERRRAEAHHAPRPA